jgi:hypothetical protein
LDGQTATSQKGGGHKAGELGTNDDDVTITFEHFTLYAVRSTLYAAYRVKRIA